MKHSLLLIFLYSGLLSAATTPRRQLPWAFQFYTPPTQQAPTNQPTAAQQTATTPIPFMQQNIQPTDQLPPLPPGAFNQFLADENLDSESELEYSSDEEE